MESPKHLPSYSVIIIVVIFFFSCSCCSHRSHAIYSLRVVTKLGSAYFCGELVGKILWRLWRFAIVHTGIKLSVFESNALKCKTGFSQFLIHYSPMDRLYGRTKTTRTSRHVPCERRSSSNSSHSIAYFNVCCLVWSKIR